MALIVLSAEWPGAILNNRAVGYQGEFSSAGSQRQSMGGLRRIQTGLAMAPARWAMACVDGGAGIASGLAEDGQCVEKVRIGRTYVEQRSIGGLGVIQPARKVKLLSALKEFLNIHAVEKWWWQRRRRRP
jgi:hypothetical protein